MRTPVTVALWCLALIAGLVPGAVRADASWLDQPVVNWNEAAMPLPQAPPMDPGTNPRCLPLGRPAETAADQALTDSGWTLFGTYQGGWNTYVVRALSGYDGMCRPIGYNEFVFVDGQFAGTISPELMSSRSDGVGDVRFFAMPDSLTAEFQRYLPTDALCCPSGHSTVVYQVSRTPDGPVLVPRTITP